ncbi:MAG: hypothetical protein ACI9M6_001699, partial [Hydrogenophaga sp.]
MGTFRRKRVGWAGSRRVQPRFQSWNFFTQTSSF